MTTNKKPACKSVDEKTIWCIHTAKYFPAVERGNYELIWSDFQGILLNEKSEVQTIIYTMLFHVRKKGRKAKQTTSKQKPGRKDIPECNCYHWEWA